MKVSLQIAACRVSPTGPAKPAGAERNVRGFALKFDTEEANWDLIGNTTRKSQ